MSRLCKQDYKKLKPGTLLKFAPGSKFYQRYEPIFVGGLIVVFLQYDSLTMTNSNFYQIQYLFEGTIQKIIRNDRYFLFTNFELV